MKRTVKYFLLILFVSFSPTSIFADNIQQRVGIAFFDGATGEFQYGRVVPTVDGASGVSLGASGLLGFNGSSWDRLRVGINADAQTPTGFLDTVSFVFNGATWDRVRASSNTADALATSALGNINTVAFPFIWNGATFDRWRDITSANGVGGTGVPAVGAMTFDGATQYRRIPYASATNLSITTITGAPLTVPLSTWSITSAPGAGAQATASKAAGGGTVRHVATNFEFCLSSTAAQTPISVTIRDGASGAGTVLRNFMAALDATNDMRCFGNNSLAIIGTANTAMTIEFAAAGGAGTSQTVNLSGFSVP